MSRLGNRNPQYAKALLYALLQPNKKLKELQDSGRFTELMMLQEELKTFPFGDIWEEYCESHKVPSDESWFDTVKQYETDVLLKRG